MGNFLQSFEKNADVMFFDYNNIYDIGCSIYTYAELCNGTKYIDIILENAKQSLYNNNDDILLQNMYNIYIKLLKDLDQDNKKIKFGEQFKFVTQTIDMNNTIKKIKNSNHKFSVYIYPPQNITGGELVIYNKNGNCIFSVYGVPKLTDKWSVIIIPNCLQYKYNDIISGTKYFFEGYANLE